MQMVPLFRMDYQSITQFTSVFLTLLQNLTLQEVSIDSIATLIHG